MSDETGEGGRRAADRRKVQKPIGGEDRRKGERRSGEDRRTTRRSQPEE